MNGSSGTATLSTPSSAAVTVNYATSDGTAIAGTDYTAALGMVTFAPGVTSQPVVIGLLNSGNYSNQSLSFTVTLSNPSSPVTLGMPPFSTVNILNANPAPVADIEINGLPPTHNGFVAVNANNDNGSALKYADGTLVPTDKTTGKPLFPGIPTMRDLDPKNIKLAVADPDHVKITLSTLGLKAGGPETIVLSVDIAGRAKIQLWDTGNKNKQIPAPANWDMVTNKMPDSLYVEGILEGADLREIILQLQILNKGKVVSSDECQLTVTPVLTDLVVTVASFGGTNAAPNIFRNRSTRFFEETGAAARGPTF